MITPIRLSPYDLDAFVAEHVYGWTRGPLNLRNDWRDLDGILAILPCFSSSPDAAENALRRLWDMYDLDPINIEIVTDSAEDEDGDPAPPFGVTLVDVGGPYIVGKGESQHSYLEAVCYAIMDAFEETK